MKPQAQPIPYMLADPAVENPHPVNSTFYGCCHAIGRHSADCTRLATVSAPASAVNGTGAGLRAGVPADLPEWRIAVPCRRCGAWLTSPRSVMAGISARCAQLEAAGE